MKNKITQLLRSKNPQSVELGFYLAKSQKIPLFEVLESVDFVLCEKQESMFSLDFQCFVYNRLVLISISIFNSAMIKTSNGEWRRSPHIDISCTLQIDNFKINAHWCETPKKEDYMFLMVMRCCWVGKMANMKIVKNVIKNIGSKWQE